MSLTGLLSSGWSRAFTPDTQSEVLFAYDYGPKSQVSSQNNLVTQVRRGNFNSPLQTTSSVWSYLPLVYSPWSASTAITGTYINSDTGSPYWSGIEDRGSDLLELTPSGNPVNDSLFSYKTDTGPSYKTKNRVNPYVSFSDGSGQANYEVNYGWQSSGDLDSGEGVLINFENLPLEIFGQSKSLSFTNIKKISMTSQTINSENNSQFDTVTSNISGLEVGGGRVASLGGSNPMFDVLGSGCHLGVNGTIDIQNPATGWPVEAGASTTISIYNAGSDTSHYEISVLGTSESGAV